MYASFTDEMIKIAKRKRPLSTGLVKPQGQGKRMKDVGLGKDKDGYFVYTHRARSRSYPTPEAIPNSAVKFIESTG